MTGLSAAIERENDAVLAAVQALCGVISPNVPGVALKWIEDDLVLYFAVNQHDAELTDDKEDALGDLAALMDTPGARRFGSLERIRSEVHVGSTWPDWDGGRARLVFLAEGQGVRTS